MIYEHKDVKSYLSFKYSESLKKNPRYSMRAFAARLGVASSTLSEVLSGKKKVSREMAAKISRSLELSAKQAEYLCLLAEKEASKSENHKRSVYEKIKGLSRGHSFLDVSVESFKMLSDWYHFAVLELLELPDLNFQVSKLANRLGITSVEFRDAIHRLERLGYVDNSGERPVKKDKVSLQVSSKVRNEALRKYHDTMLERSKAYLASQDPLKRFVGSETLVFDEAALEEANEIFEDCFQKIIALSERAKKPKHVFYLGIQFFSLTKGDK